MAKNIIFLHGAWASPMSFNFITKNLIGDERIKSLNYFVYDTNAEKIGEVLIRAQEELTDLAKNGEEIIVIGHSLGGVMALYLNDHPSVSQIITMSAPLSGVRFPLIVQYYISSALVKMLAQQSNFIVEVQKKEYKKPVTVIASVYGFSPAIYEPNDGVITISSQLSWTPADARVHELRVNHHEILQSPDVVSIIKDHL